MSVFRQARQKKGTSADLLVVGLGNPGERFQQTRHNIGAETARAFVAKHDGSFSNDRRRKALSCELRLDDQRVVVVCPTTFMNESGLAVRALIKRHGITDPLRLVVLYDELDLVPGRLKLKLGGGTAGHNGLKSIQAHIKTLDFLRLRIGIGKPPAPAPGAVWVLKRPSRDERDVLNVVVTKALKTLDVLVSSGVEAAMNVANAP